MDFTLFHCNVKGQISNHSFWAAHTLISEPCFFMIFDNSLACLKGILQQNFKACSSLKKTPKKKREILFNLIGNFPRSPIRSSVLVKQFSRTICLIYYRDNWQAFIALSISGLELLRIRAMLRKCD